MPIRDPGTRLWGEALEMLREADRMHRQFFTLALGRPGPCWEPPVDIVEDAKALTIRVALPGVAKDEVEVHTDGARLHVLGRRPLAQASTTTIHRIEIPFGRFERTIELPPGHYDIGGREFIDGCLVLTLRRLP